MGLHHRESTTLNLRWRCSSHMFLLSKDAKLRGVQVPWKDIALGNHCSQYLFRMSMVLMINVFAVYSCMGCFILLAWCWGLSLFMWQKFRINSMSAQLWLFEKAATYKHIPVVSYLFELNALKTSSYMVIWREGYASFLAKFAFRHILHLCFSDVHHHHLSFELFAVLQKRSWRIPAAL